MADDKRIRVSADSSPLQELRQGAQALWDDLTRMETRFKGLAEETVASIQKQIDLLKERNSLAGGLSDGGYTFQPPQSQSHIIDPSTGRYTDGRTPGQSMRSVDSTIATKQLTVFDRILAQVLRIADSIESENRNETNGVLPVGGENNGGGGGVPTPPVNPKGGGGVPKSGFKIPTSIGGALAGAGIAGAIITGIGMLAGKISGMYAQEYTAENRFQRENQRWSWIPFVGNSIAQVKEADRQAGARFEQPGSQAARLSGSTYHNAAREAIRQSGVDVNYENDVVERTEFVTTGSGMNVHFTPITRYYDKTTGKEVSAPMNKGDQGYQNSWYSQSLGLSMSQYTQRQNELTMAAGGRPTQSTPYRLEQLMLAEQIRGISKSDSEMLQGVTRFGSDQKYESGSAYAVISTFDKTLQMMGKTNSEIVGTLSEYLGQFNRTATQVLEKTDSVNTAAVTQTIASLRTRGFEGRQLERFANSLSGGNISKDDTTQALLLRTARQLNPNGSLSDLMADIDEMQNGGDLAPEFFDKLKEMTGGGEMFRHVLKAVYPDLSYSDIRKATTGKNKDADGRKFLRAVGISKDGYSRKAAEDITGTQEADTAAESTRKEIEGIDKVQKAAGKNLKDKETPNNINEQPTQETMLLLKSNEEQRDGIWAIHDILKRFEKEPFSLIVQ